MFLKENILARRFYLMAVIALASFAVYANTLQNGFVSDDMLQVLQNPWIKDVKFLPEIFTSSAWGFHGHASSNYYRPLMNVILMVNYYVFGLTPWGFHLTNVLFHTANCLLVFIIAARLFPSGRFPLMSPFFAALIFAVHPIHSESVAWVSGITDLSVTFFVLLSFDFYIRSDGAEQKRYYLYSLGCFLLSLLCKEPAVLLPFILLASDIAFRSKNESFALHVRRLLPFVVVAGIYFVVRFIVLGGLSPLKVNKGLDFYLVVLNIFPLFMQYLELLLLPIHLRALRLFMPVVSPLEARAIVGFAVSGAYLAFAAIAFKKNKPVFFGLVLIVVPLLPVAKLIMLGESVLADRYLYLSTFGFAVLVSMAAVTLREKLPAFRSLVLILLVVALGLYSIQTIKRNAVWKTDLSLATDVVQGHIAQGSPDSESEAMNVSDAMLEDGHFDEAIELCQSVITKINPDSDEAYFELGRGLQKKELSEEAIQAFEKSLSLNPQSAIADKVHYDVALSYLDLSKIEPAIEHLKTAVELRPSNPFYHNLLGIAYGSNASYDLAIAEFKKAIKLEPDSVSARDNLAHAELKAKAVRGQRR